MAEIIKENQSKYNVSLSANCLSSIIDITKKEKLRKRQKN